MALLSSLRLRGRGVRCDRRRERPEHPLDPTRVHVVGFDGIFVSAGIAVAGTTWRTSPLWLGDRAQRVWPPGAKLRHAAPCGATLRRRLFWLLPPFPRVQFPLSGASLSPFP